MKKLLTMFLFSFLLSGYAGAKTPTYVIDEAATAAMSLKVGQPVDGNGFACTENNKCISIFLGVTVDRFLVCQYFYETGEKFSDPFLLLRLGNGKIGHDGYVVTWHKNGQKFAEGNYDKGDRVGIWKEWDEQGNLIWEKNYDPAK